MLPTEACPPPPDCAHARRFDMPADDGEAPPLVAVRHWWNELPDGSWLDLTPPLVGSGGATNAAGAMGAAAGGCAPRSGGGGGMPRAGAGGGSSTPRGGVGGRSGASGKGGGGGGDHPPILLESSLGDKPAEAVTEELISFGEWFGRRFCAHLSRTEASAALKPRRRGHHTWREDWEIVGGNFLQRLLGIAARARTAAVCTCSRLTAVCVVAAVAVVAEEETRRAEVRAAEAAQLTQMAVAVQSAAKKVRFAVAETPKVDLVLELHDRALRGDGSEGAALPKRKFSARSRASSRGDDSSASSSFIKQLVEASFKQSNAPSSVGDDSQDGDGDEAEGPEAVQAVGRSSHAVFAAAGVLPDGVDRGQTPPSSERRGKRAGGRLTGADDEAHPGGAGGDGEVPTGAAGGDRGTSADGGDGACSRRGRGGDMRGDSSLLRVAGARKAASAAGR